MSTRGNPVFLVFGILTLPLFGLGLLFIVLYFLLPRHFLVTHSNNYITALNCRGDLQPYHDFADAVTRAAIEAQESSSGSHAAPHAAPHALLASPAQAPASKVTCPGCGTEYKLPAGAAGRRLRCQKCQSIVG